MDTEVSSAIETRSHQTNCCVGRQLWPSPRSVVGTHPPSDLLLAHWGRKNSVGKSSCLDVPLKLGMFILAVLIGARNEATSSWAALGNLRLNVVSLEIATLRQNMFLISSLNTTPSTNSRLDPSASFRDCFKHASSITRLCLDVMFRSCCTLLNSSDTV